VNKPAMSGLIQNSLPVVTTYAGEDARAPSQGRKPVFPVKLEVFTTFTARTLYVMIKGQVRNKGVT